MLQHLLGDVGNYPYDGAVGLHIGAHFKRQTLVGYPLVVLRTIVAFTACHPVNVALQGRFQPGILRTKIATLPLPVGHLLKGRTPGQKLFRQIKQNTQPPIEKPDALPHIGDQYPLVDMGQRLQQKIPVRRARQATWWVRNVGRHAHGT
ncbi:hypothetical protein GALL_439050 [mine drainage metagenome]|uniref:Uncharacterized protein n=1 Tax=mine drainage metagenome TaxID=410659 RepID=A0A1J5QAB9_9ZZZZ